MVRWERQSWAKSDKSGSASHMTNVFSPHPPSPSHLKLIHTNLYIHNNLYIHTNTNRS